MSITESKEQGMQWETAPQPADGMVYLKERFGHHPENLATNVSVALVGSLRASEAALATGRDIKILGVESQELGSEVLSHITEPEPHAGLGILFEFFARKSGKADDNMRAIMQEYALATQTYRANFSAMSAQERQAEIDNLRPMTRHLQYLSEAFIDTRLESGLVLPCEGGNPDNFDLDLLRDLCDPFYLNFLFEDKAERPSARSGFNGQVCLRLIAQARSWDMVQPNNTQTQ